LDIRVGKIIACKKIEGSEKLLEEQVDLGEEYGTVTILSGIAQYYQPNDLVGKKCLFIANLEPRKIMGTFSHGIMLAADDGQPHIVFIDPVIKDGTIIR